MSGVAKEKKESRCWQCQQPMVILRRILTDSSLQPILDKNGAVQITHITTEICGNKECIHYQDASKIRTWRRV